MYTPPQHLITGKKREQQDEAYMALINAMALKQQPKQAKDAPDAMPIIAYEQQKGAQPQDHYKPQTNQ